MNALEFPEVKMPKDHQTPAVYITALKDLHQQSSWNKQRQTDVWDRGKGWISFQQGQILNLIIESNKCKHGDYGKVLQTVGLKEGTAYNCRRIAKKYSEKHAKIYGYSVMLKGLGWESIDTKADLPDDGLRKVPDSKKKTTRKPRNIKADNLKKHLAKMLETAKGIQAMDLVHLGRDDSRVLYEETIAELIQVRRVIEKTEADFKKRIVKLLKAAA